MPYKYETQHSTPSSAFTQGRPGAPTEVVIHHYGPDDATYESSIAWLTRRDAVTSAHYVVDAGRVACIVDPDDTAWHSGSWPVNQRAIGIENHPVWTQAREDTLVELCVALERQYGSLNYSVHQNHSSTACPGRWVSRVPAIIDRINAQLAHPAGTASSKPRGYVHTPGKKAYHTVKSGDTLAALGRYYGVSVPLVVKWNRLASADMIRVGDVLRVR